MHGLILMLLACSDRTPDDTAVSAPPICDPLTLSVVQEWTEEQLPDRNDRDQRRPGLGVGDLDGDDDLDVLLAYGGGSVVLVNDGTGALTMDESLTADGDLIPDASAAALADVDGDGDLDAFLGRQWETLDSVLINDGTGHFTITSLSDSGASPSGGVFGDLDGDGDLDLVVGRLQESPEPDLIVAGKEVGEGLDLYFNDGSGGFTLDNSSLPEYLSVAMVWEPELVDVDLDGDLDLYLANDFGPWLVPNTLLLNDGSGRFSVSEDCFCDLEMYAMGSAVGDVNDDGYPDLYVTDIAGPNLLISDGTGGFYDGTLAAGADIPPAERNMSSWGTVFADVDADMDLDLAVMFGRLGRNSDFVGDLDESWVDGDEQDDVLLLNDGDNTFTRADEVGFTDADRGRLVVTADLDRDGRLELITAGKHFVRIWRSEGGCGTGLTVALEGDSPHGIGARVTVEAADRSVTQWMLPGGTASSGAMELYFGLGGAASAERVTVSWLDGGTTVREDVAAGERLLLQPE
jgi:hypothetical protein